MWNDLNIVLSIKCSNNKILNTEIIYYTHWKNNYHYNIYERQDLLTLFLIQCEKQYYLAKPIISDHIFDRLLRELKEIENKLNFSYECSPTNKIGKR